MNNRLILVYITGILIGISYGLQGPLLPVFAKNVIGASYADLGAIGFCQFHSIHVLSIICWNFTKSFQ